MTDDRMCSPRWWRKRVWAKYQFASTFY